MALTARELAKQRRRDRAARERDLRKKDRALLAELRKRVKQARAHKRKRLRAIRATCRRARKAAVLRARSIRAAHRAAAAQEVTALYSRGRTQCEADKVAAATRGGDSLARATAVLEAERRHQSTVRRYEKPAPSSPRSSKATRRARYRSGPGVG